MSSPENNTRRAFPAWERQIPEAVLELYLDSLRFYPKWQKMYPSYTLPEVQLATELAYNVTQIKTRRAEYIFTFNQRTTSIDEIAEVVTTGELQLLCDNTLVLKLGTSYSCDEKNKPEWLPRSVEIFVDGEWVDELLDLASRHKEHERNRVKLATVERLKDIEEVEKLRGKFAPPAARCRCSGHIRTIYMPGASRRYRPASGEYIRRADSAGGYYGTIKPRSIHRSINATFRS